MWYFIAQYILCNKTELLITLPGPHRERKGLGMKKKWPKR